MEKDDPTLRKWWAAYKDRALKALAMSLGIDREELLDRLGVTAAKQVFAALGMEHTLNLSVPKVPTPKRRGRPRRVIDAKVVRAALKRHKGNVRAAARATGIPRATFTRFVAREVTDLPRLLAKVHKLMRNSRGVVHTQSVAESILRVSGVDEADRATMARLMRDEYSRRRAARPKKRPPRG